MDVESDLSLYSFLGFLVSLLVFHLCLLSSLKGSMKKALMQKSAASETSRLDRLVYTLYGRELMGEGRGVIYM